MKKLLLVILCLILCTTVFTACELLEQLLPQPTPENPTHEHSWSSDWSTSETEHWYACTSDDCAELDSKALHTGGTATCLERAKCEVCGTSYGDLADHVFDKEVADAGYLASEATCTDKATYYKSCACGAKGTVTFESGSLAAHTPAPAVDENVINPSCNADGSKDVVVYCSECDSELSRTNTLISSTGEHNYDYAALVYKLEGDAQHSIKCSGCDTYSAPVDCTGTDDSDCTTAVDCVCGRELTEAKAHSHTGAPVWTSADNAYTATYACDNDGCTAASKSVTVAVHSASGLEALIHTEDDSAFKFSFTLAEGYYLVSVKIGDNALEAVDGVYSAPIADSEITITASNMYEIKFVDHDYTAIGDTLTLAYGSAVTAPADPTRAQVGSTAYTFAGWTPEVTAVVGDATYRATYTEYTVMCKVTFMSADGKTVLQESEVEYGTVPTYSGEALENEIWLNFSRAVLSDNIWDSELAEVTADTVYTAKYDKLYEFQILAMRGDVVTTTAPNCGGYNKEFSVSTRANIQQTDKYRVTLASTSLTNADYREHDSISFYVRVNYDGISFSTVDNVVFFSAIKNVNYLISVDKSGQVYINGVLLDGISMSNGVIEFNVTRNPDTDTYAYLELTNLSYDGEIAPEFASQLGDMYTANHSNGTKTVTPATNAEKVSMGITHYITYTSTSYRQNALDSFDLTPYQVVKFYAKRVTAGKLVIAGKDFYADNSGAWVEFRFEKNGSGFDLYVGGVKQDLGETVITNLNQIQFNINTGSFMYTDVLVDSESHIVPVDVSLTIGSDGAISYEGVTVQTITLPTARVWNLNEANAQLVTITLTDAGSVVGSLTVNGVSLDNGEATVNINSVLYLLGQPDYSVAGQVSFKIAYIQDSFYWNADNVVNIKNLVESDGTYTVGSQYNFADNANSKITSEKGVAAQKANTQKIDGVWYDNWRISLNKTGMDSISFYMVFSYNGGQLYAKDGIGDPTKLIHTFVKDEVVLVTIQRDGSVLIDGVDTGVDTSKDSFTLDFYNGGSANTYGAIEISSNYWRYNKV